MDEQRRWFAVRVRTRLELPAAKSIRLQGITSFCPCGRVRKKWSDRIVTADVPLFPGYLFAQFTRQQKLAILKTAGVIEIVSVAGSPAPVDPGEILAIEQIVRSGVQAEAHPYVSRGDRIRIDDGPLRGIEGFVVHTPLERSIVVSVTLLGRSVKVSVPEDSVTPLSFASATSHI
jgi:transcription antitermination factor NusG